jgi:hypothetical protein
MLGDVSDNAVTTRRTKVLILAACVAWMAFACACIAAFGVVRGGVIGVWGVSIVAIGAAGLRHLVLARIHARAGHGDAYGEKTLDVLAERELQTV